MKDSIGSICCKEELVGTEYECACQECDIKGDVAWKMMEPLTLIFTPKEVPA